MMMNRDRNFLSAKTIRTMNFQSLITGVKDGQSSKSLHTSK
jgi:hypothetical protein